MGVQWSYCLVPRDVLDAAPSIGPTAVTCYIALAEMANGLGECWPGLATLAARIGRSERQIRTALRRLEAAGLVETTQRGQTSNVFRLPKHPARPAENRRSEDGRSAENRREDRRESAALDRRKTAAERESQEREPQERDLDGTGRDDHLHVPSWNEDAESRTLVLARRVAAVVPVSVRNRAADRSLILKAAALVALGSLPEAWLVDATEAVKHGSKKTKPAGYLFRVLEAGAADRGVNFKQALARCPVPAGLVAGSDAPGSQRRAVRAAG